MLEIEKQIKRLQRIKTQIELLSKIVDNLNKEVESKSKEHQALEVEHPGLLKETVEQLTNYCNSLINQLGEGEKPKTPKSTTQSTISESLEKTDIPLKKNPIQSDKEAEEPSDPLRFLLKYRHLDGKKVVVTTPDGVVEGTVRGVRVPNLVVETVTGFEALVPPRSVKEIING